MICSGWPLALLATAFAVTAAPEFPQNQNPPEVSTKEEVAVFQSKVTLIEVPVVVRDRNGKAVGTLRQEDFQLFDKGKPQVISKFSIEKSGSGKAIAQVATSEAAPAPEAKGNAPPVIAPDHFVGLLFDDVHAKFADLAYARTAAQKFVASDLKPADRAAVFTTSGQTVLDFTDDRDALNKTLMKLRPHPLGSNTPLKCPEISLYQADQMLDVHDADAIAVAVGDYEKCFPSTPYPVALQFALGHARAVLEEGQFETRATIVSIRDVVRKMAEMPGQRTLILASPGFFLMPDQHQDEGPAIDLAIRSGVVINALDVRGVIAFAAFNAENSSANTRGDKFDRVANIVQSDVLDELTSGTGGRFFRGNDLTKGLQDLAAAPEAYYLLGFSPQNLKPDGAFHSLKVSLKTSAGMSVQARRGYYAPTHLASAEEDAKEEITQALFSLDEMSDIPVGMNTRFFKASESEARLSVTSRVDVRKLRFRKADGRNVDNVRVVCALFDRDGNFVQADARMIEMNLLDATLQNNKLSDGISVRSDFTVAPGTYVIRLVVRDAEGQTMSAQNGAVKIP